MFSPNHTPPLPCRDAVGGLERVHDIVDVVIVLLKLAELLDLVGLLHVLNHRIVLQTGDGRWFGVTTGYRL